MKKYLAWFSCGVTSAVACKLAIEQYGKESVDVWYIETGAAHNDNSRFIEDCERWYGQKILTARSDKYRCPLHVAEKQLFNTPYGAPCTKYLKKEVRQKNIMPRYDGVETYHVLGFEYTRHEVNRALRWLQQQTPNAVFPLIEKRFSKKRCLLELKKQQIEIPEMYKLGYRNNNCIGCFKGGMGYWNKIRKDFPDVFRKTMELEIKTHHTCLKKNHEPLYLRDLPENAGRKSDLDIPQCDLFCELEDYGLPDKSTEEVVKQIQKIYLDTRKERT